MRKTFLCLAAMLLAGCKTTATYPTAQVDTFNKLSSIGTTPGMDPLPGGLSPVSVSFESVPGDNLVRWSFSHEGEDLGRIEAVVAAKGNNSSEVSIYYVDGTAPKDHWRNREAEQLIKDEIQRLAVEAVDSTMTNRPFDRALKQKVALDVMSSSIGGMMQDASKAMDDAAEKFHQYDEEAAAAQREAQVEQAQHDVGKPSTDLSGSH